MEDFLIYVLCVGIAVIGVWAKGFLSSTRHRHWYEVDSARLVRLTRKSKR